jgi:hypothetical protein
LQTGEADAPSATDDGEDSDASLGRAVEEGEDVDEFPLTPRELKKLVVAGWQCVCVWATLCRGALQRSRRARAAATKRRACAHWHLWAQLSFRLNTLALKVYAALSY